jgi:hypothetical protein
MGGDDIQVLFDYIDALENVLQAISPGALQKSELVQKRDRLLPFLQKQREWILSLQREIAETQAQNESLQSALAKLQQKSRS